VSVTTDETNAQRGPAVDAYADVSRPTAEGAPWGTNAAFAALRVPVLAIQSTTRNAQLQRAPLKPGDTSPWLDYVKSKGAKVEIIPDTGHFTQLEAPDQVNRLIREFCR